MAKPLLEVGLVGYDKVQIRLNKIKGLDATEILEDVAAVLLNRIRTRFLDQIDPDGNKWPVSKAAIKRKESGRDGGTLFDTGRLFHSIQAASRGRNQIGIFTDVPYSIYHQEGTKVLPKRVFLGFSDEDVTVATAVFNNRLREVLDA